MIENEITFSGNIASWTMPPTNGDIQGTYTGTFEFRAFLDPLRQLEAGRQYRELLGSLGNFADETEVRLAFALTQLKYRILKAPPFWSSTLQESGIAGNIGDINIVALVLEAANTAETLYRDKMKTERDGLVDKAIKLAEQRVKNEEV